MLKTITKSEVLRSGTNAKGPWSLFKVTDTEGKTYTTFAKFPLNQEVEVIIEPSPNGRGENIKLIEPKKSPQESLDGEILVELKAIRTLLKDLVDRTPII